MQHDISLSSREKILKDDSSWDPESRGPSIVANARGCLFRWSSWIIHAQPCVLVVGQSGAIVIPLPSVSTMSGLRLCKKRRAMIEMLCITFLRFSRCIFFEQSTEETGKGRRRDRCKPGSLDLWLLFLAFHFFIYNPKSWIFFIHTRIVKWCDYYVIKTCDY